MKKQKNNESKFLKNVWTAIKKGSQAEKLKKEEKAKRQLPKGYVARKIGVYVFWIIIIMLFLLVFFTFTIVADMGNDKTSNDEIANSSATTLEASEFAKKFLSLYLSRESVNTDNLGATQENRKFVLGQYVTNDILDRIVKVDYSNWQISVKGLSLQSAKIENDSYQLTYETTLYYKPVEVEGTESSDGKQVIPKKLEPFTKVQYMTVTVAHINGEYTIYEVPHFVGQDTTNTIEDIDETKPFKEVHRGAAKIDIENFLETFFDALTNDTKEKLSYLTTKDVQINGFEGAFAVNNIGDLQIFEGKEKNEYLVYVNVDLEEVNSKVLYPTTYNLVVVNEDNTYLIKAFNDKKYVHELSKQKELEAIESQK